MGYRVPQRAIDSLRSEDADEPTPPTGQDRGTHADQA